MKKLFILSLLFVAALRAQAQHPSMLKIPAGTQAIYINVDQVTTVKKVGAYETRVYTKSRTYYTATVPFDTMVQKYGQCKLLQLITDQSDTIAVSYASISHINQFTDTTGLVTVGGRTRYRITNMTAVKDSIMYSHCGVGAGITLLSPLVESVIIANRGNDTFDVIVCLFQSAGLDDVASVNIIFEEPYEGPAPLETEINCVDIGGECYLNLVAVLEFDPGESPAGYTYLILTDMLNSTGGIIGVQQEFEVVVQ